MLTDYIRAAMRHATYELLEDGYWFGHIAPIRGVWSHEPTREEAEQDLRSALEDWLFLGLRRDWEIPVIDGIDLNVSRVA